MSIAQPLALVGVVVVDLDGDAASAAVDDENPFVLDDEPRALFIDGPGAQSRAVSILQRRFEVGGEFDEVFLRDLRLVFMDGQTCKVFSKAPLGVALNCVPVTGLDRRVSNYYFSKKKSRSTRLAA